MAKRLLIPILIVAAAYGAYYFYSLPPTSLVLTGIVTTHDVVISPQIGGRLAQITVKEGDTVTKGQVIAEIAPAELAAERAFYDYSAEGLASQVRESEAALRFEEKHTADQIKQAEGALTTVESQRAAAVSDAERAKVTFDRTRELFNSKLLRSTRETSG